jgi:hypothetical protein
VVDNDLPAKGYIASFKATMNRLQSKPVNYNPLTQNSNTFAASLLYEAKNRGLSGFPRELPGPRVQANGAPTVDGYIIVPAFLPINPRWEDDPYRNFSYQ